MGLLPIQAWLSYFVFCEFEEMTIIAEYCHRLFRGFVKNLVEIHKRALTI